MRAKHTIAALMRFGLWAAVACAMCRLAAAQTGPSPSDRDAMIAQARAHWAAGVAYWNKGQFDHALNEAQATLDLYQKVYGGQDNPDVAMTLTGVGSCLLNLYRDDEALPKFQAAMEMYRRIYKNRDEQLLGIAIGNVGWCLHCLGRDEEALPYCQGGMEMQRRIHKGQDDPNVVLAMQNLAQCQESLDHYQKALQAYQAVLEMKVRIDKGQDRPDLAQAQESVAGCLQQLGRSAQAMVMYQSALEMRKRLGQGADRADVAQDIENVAGCLDDLGRSAEALPMYRQALEMRRRIYGGQDARDIAASLNDTASCLDYLGRSAEALPIYQQALDMDKRLFHGSDDEDLATDMNNVAGCAARLGHRDEALKLYRDAWQMRQRIYKGEDSPDLAESLDSIAGCLDGMGRSAEALPIYVAAMQMRGRIYEGKDHPDLAQSMNNVAICLSNNRRPAEALPLDQAALEMFQRIYAGHDHPNVAASMFSVAFDLWFLGRNADAVKMFQATTRMGERLKSPDLFRYSSALGSMEMIAGHPEDAAKSFEESIDSLEQARSALGGDDQDRMGFMAANQGWDPFSGMVRAQLELNHADTAAEFLDRGRAKSLLDILERGERLSNGDLLDPLEKKARLTNDTEELKQITEVRTAVSAAEDQVRQLTSQINHARSLNSDEGLAQIKELLPQLNQAYQRYADAHRRKFNLAGRTTFTESTTSVQIQSLLQPREHLLMYSITGRDAVLLVVPPPGQTISGTYLTAADGKTKLSGLALQRLIRSYRQAVLRHGMNSVRGARLAQTEPTTRPVEDVAEAGYKLFCQLMPEKVWRQIQGDDLVYVVPDASMSGLPLEMLIPQKPKSQEAKDNVYWLDCGPLLCYGPSAAALLELRHQEPDRAGRTYAHEAVLLGDPVLQRNPGDSPHEPPPHTGALVTSVPPGSAAEAIGLRKGAVIVGYGPIAVGTGDQFQNAVDKLALLQFHGKLDQTPKLKFWLEGQVLERELPLDAAPGIDELSDMTAALALEWSPVHVQPTTAVAMRDSSLTRYGALSPLPGTRQEVEGIYQVLTGRAYSAHPDKSVVVLLGEEATNQRLSEAVQGTRYLHLATHGLVEPGQDVIYSSVALSQPEVITPQDTGLLTLQDLIEHWWGRLDGTELVVLSACDSEGLDERGSSALGGEGVFGLPWGFMYAGSPAVVASLWEVQDASTAKLMQRFYRDMQVAPPTSKLSAFTSARKQLKKDYPEPFFWAPFIYLGDPN